MNAKMIIARTFAGMGGFLCASSRQSINSISNTGSMNEKKIKLSISITISITITVTTQAISSYTIIQP